MGCLPGAIPTLWQETVQFSQAPSLLLRSLRLADDASGLRDLYEAQFVTGVGVI